MSAMKLLNRKIKWMYGIPIKRIIKEKKDAKARMEGYATPDTTLKDRNVIKQKLGQGYSYNISIIDSKDTIQRLKKL